MHKKHEAVNVPTAAKYPLPKGVRFEILFTNLVHFGSKWNMLSMVAFNNCEQSAPL